MPVLALQNKLYKFVEHGHGLAFTGVGRENAQTLSRDLVRVRENQNSFLFLLSTKSVSSQIIKQEYLVPQFDKRIYLKIEFKMSIQKMLYME